MWFLFAVFEVTRLLPPPPQLLPPLLSLRVKCSVKGEKVETVAAQLTTRPGKIGLRVRTVHTCLWAYGHRVRG